MLAADELYDVDDGPLLRKRRMVMTMCTVQIVVSLALLANARRNPVLLALNPFFVAAGALGYVSGPVHTPRGARRAEPLRVIAHDARSFHPGQVPSRRAPGRRPLSRVPIQTLRRFGSLT